MRVHDHCNLQMQTITFPLANCGWNCMHDIPQGSVCMNQIKSGLDYVRKCFSYEEKGFTRPVENIYGILHSNSSLLLLHLLPYLQVSCRCLLEAMWKIAGISRRRMQITALILICVLLKNLNALREYTMSVLWGLSRLMKEEDLKGNKMLLILRLRPLYL